jgi:hypothetical protein
MPTYIGQFKKQLPLLAPPTSDFDSSPSPALACAAIRSPLTAEELRIIEYYCNEMLTKLFSPSMNPERSLHSEILR